MQMNFIQELPGPDAIKCKYPLLPEYAAKKEAFDAEIKEVFSGTSQKFILLIGPCSADNEDAVLDYCTRLRDVQEKVKDKIIMIPRVYTNKPRTTGEGYKGMLHQPDPTKEDDILHGILKIRKLHTDIIAKTGFFCADEMLYPENCRYMSDLLSYITVGARSVENQQHRLTSSGFSIPVGMKNPTSGDYNVMLNAILAAQHGHTFIYGGWEVKTGGNPYAHAILRGFVNERGEVSPNYHYDDLIRLYEAYAEKNLKNMALIVDVNHANSNKQHLEQIRITKEVLHSARHSSDIKSFLKGFMIESYIEDGCQQIQDGIYGKSITDPCLGWEKTERLIFDIADSI